ncbi:MAG: tetratricopeptide repeat-containing serine/threonine-protein kinase [Candidatus Aminicenantes bacterium]|nr:tetratricopeptide repeat-containing serine/threonine-protein kinase [Candidatus Aminicenantes bacterium]
MPLDPGRDLPAITATLETPAQKLTSGALFTERYRIIEELGQGGMGKVYRAFDQKLNEEVALKLIRADIARDRGTLDRFSAELRMARKVVHKNVGRVFELMEDRGIQFITMEYVQGQDLRGLIRQTGRLTTAKAVAIARQICDGLAEAHRLGIVHRDLKPGNIMIDKAGDARIMDFGIARLMDGPGTTREGLLVGTPEYMSPEQVEGNDLDGRSDIYSLGVVLFEMVTGRAPFEGPTPLSIALKHKTEPPPDPREANPLVPEDLSLIILKCMAKGRGDRYQRAEEVGTDLAALEEGTPTTERKSTRLKPSRVRPASAAKRRVRKRFFFAGGIGLLGLAVYFGFILISKPRAFIDSIAVLPFENATPEDHSLDYLCDGLPDTIRPKLSGWPNLKNIARESARSFKGRTSNTGKIGQDLKVQAILTGTVRKTGDRLSVSPALVRTRDGSLIKEWAYSAKAGGKPEELIVLLEDVEFAAVLLRELGRKLNAEENRKVSTLPIKNPAAYEYYLRAYQESDLYTIESVNRAQDYLKRAIELEGNSALLDAGMAGSYLTLCGLDFRTSETNLNKADEYLAKALTKNPDLPEAHAWAGLIEYAFRGNPGKAIRSFKRALAGNPDEPVSLCFLAFTYIEYVGRMSAAVPLYKKLEQVDPQNWGNNWIPGGINFYSGLYDKAVDSWRPVFRDHSEDSALAFWYSQALIYKGRTEEAFRLIDKNEGTSPSYYSLTRINVMLKAALQKDLPRVARVMTPEFLSSCRNNGVASRIVAASLAVLGEKKQALDWLQNAVDRGFWNYPFLDKDPFLKSLRGEARFKAILDQARKEWERFED